MHDETWRAAYADCWSVTTERHLGKRVRPKALLGVTKVILYFLHGVRSCDDSVYTARIDGYFEIVSNGWQCARFRFGVAVAICEILLYDHCDRVDSY